MSNAMTTAPSQDTWISVVELDRLGESDPVAALVQGAPVALVRVGSEVFALDAIDPYSGAAVMARGIVGSRGDRPTLASPMYKQIFDLRTGECVETVGKEPRSLATYPVRVHEGVIQVERPGHDLP